MGPRRYIGHSSCDASLGLIGLSFDRQRNIHQLEQLGIQIGIHACGQQPLVGINGVVPRTELVGPDEDEYFVGQRKDERR